MALSSKVRRHYNVEGTLAFLHVNLMDNRSDFLTVRLRPGDSKRLKGAAARAGVSVSDYVRSLVLKATRA